MERRPQISIVPSLSQNPTLGKLIIVASVYDEAIATILDACEAQLPERFPVAVLRDRPGLHPNQAWLQTTNGSDLFGIVPNICNMIQLDIIRQVAMSRND